MKIWIFGLAFFFAGSAWANDPFDKTQRDHRISQTELTEQDDDITETSNTPQGKNCGTDENRQAANIPLQDLKLTGVMISKEQAFALFVDKTQQLYFVTEGTDMAQEGYWLEKVTKENVQLMRKIGMQCDRVETKTLTF